MNMEEIEKEEEVKLTKNLLSHSKEEEEFYKAYKSGKLHHSWLICGNKGIGKATLCYRIARYIFSLNNQNHLKDLNINIDTTKSILESINENEIYEDENEEEEYLYSEGLDFRTDKENIKEMDIEKYDDSPLKLAKNHPIYERLIKGGITDLIIIEREYTDSSKTKLKTEITIDQIRKLKDFFSKTSSEGSYRIAIIDSIDEMNTNSKNALLKILEEAPSKSLLLLVCHNINGILPTIKSRCRILKLKEIDETNMRILLKSKFDQIEEEEIEKLLDISEGSIGKAITIYKNEGLQLSEKIYEIIPEILNDRNIGILEITKEIKEETKLNILKEIIIKFIDKVIKKKSGLKIKTIGQNEEIAINSMAIKYKNIKSLFRLREEILNNIEIQSKLNLDISCVVINVFERIKNVY